MSRFKEAILSKFHMPSPVRVYQLLKTEGHTNHGVTVSNVDDMACLKGCLQEIGLVEQRPTLVLVGGASGLDDDQQLHLDSLFNGVLAPLAEELQLYVVDGGTDAGVMRLMGKARAAIGGTFALVGVTPRSLVHLPDSASEHPDASTLEPNHTHCILVPGKEWGDESPWIAEIATQLSGPNESITVLINGGSITWQDAYASVTAGREIAIMAGSGRTADVMVRALEGKPIDDPRVNHLLSSGLLSSIDLENPPAELREAIMTLLLRQ